MSSRVARRWIGVRLIARRLLACCCSGVRFRMSRPGRDGDRARRDGVGGDVPVPQLARPCNGQGVESRLAGRVGRHSAGQLVARRDRHQSAIALLLHRGDDGTGHQERPLEVDPDDAVEGRLVHRRVIVLDQDAGVVHQHVDASASFEDQGDARLDRHGRRHVHLHGECIAAQLLWPPLRMPRR